MARGRQTGRILPHQRDTDDSVPIIFADAVINEEHAAAVHTTESQGMKPKTRNEYRNQHKHLMVFWQNKYPQYFLLGTVLLTDEEKNDPNKYYYNNQHDLRYTGINVKLITAFLSSKKTKANGNLVHPSHLSKYGDAIKWATVAGKKLPTEYHIGMDKFIRAYKKEFEFAEAKKNNNKRKSEGTEQTTRNPGRFPNYLTVHLTRPMGILFEENYDHGGAYIAEINEGSSAAVDGSICRGDQLIAIGEKTVIGMDFDDIMQIIESDIKIKLKVFRGPAESLYGFLRISQFHAHGIRKGSGTHASPATALPPQFTSVAARGEWEHGEDSSGVLLV